MPRLTENGQHERVKSNGCGDMVLGAPKTCKGVATALAVAALCIGGCKPDETDLRTSINLAGDAGGKKEQPSPRPTNENSSPGSLTLLSDSEAMAFLKQNCSACHGVDEEGTPGANFSAWPMTDAELTAEALEVSFFAPIVYQAMANKLLKTPSAYPPAMPYGGGQATGEQAKQLMQMLAWFQVNLPLVVAEAEDIYGVSIDSKLSSEISFICAEPVTLRVFINRFTNTLFDRLPRPEELSLFPAAALDRPVTAEQRQELVQRLWSNDSWRQEFEQIGLWKLAKAIGGAPALRPVGELSAEIIEDLKKEFYRSMLVAYNSADYGSLFTSDWVYVTRKTAPLYSCDFDSLEPIEFDQTWRICSLELPRSGFFTTIGYLASRPQSFLEEANNYGRVASMYFTLAGEGFRAADTGPAGSGIVQPLPDCLEKDDTRAVTGAPRGSAAVPQFGNNCQGCHISRNLASGSVLFRDFSPDGQIYTAENLEDISPEEVEEATTEDWRFKEASTNEEHQVTREFLKHLLTVEKKSCSVPFNPSEQPKIHRNVNDLAKHLMSNRKRLARGFMRHAQRAFLNSETVNFDLVYRAVSHVEEDETITAKELIEHYLESETFACKVR